MDADSVATRVRAAFDPCASTEERTGHLSFLEGVKALPPSQRFGIASALAVGTNTDDASRYFALGLLQALVEQGRDDNVFAFVSQLVQNPRNDKLESSICREAIAKVAASCAAKLESYPKHAEAFLAPMWSSLELPIDLQRHFLTLSMLRLLLDAPFHPVQQVVSKADHFLSLLVAASTSLFEAQGQVEQSHLITLLDVIARIIPQCSLSQFDAMSWVPWVCKLLYHAAEIQNAFLVAAVRDVLASIARFKSVKLAECSLLILQCCSQCVMLPDLEDQITVLLLQLVQTTLEMNKLLLGHCVAHAWKQELFQSLCACAKHDDLEASTLSLSCIELLLKRSRENTKPNSSFAVSHLGLVQVDGVPFLNAPDVEHILPILAQKMLIVREHVHENEQDEDLPAFSNIANRVILICADLQPGIALQFVIMLLKQHSKATDMKSVISLRMCNTVLGSKPVVALMKEQAMDTPIYEVFYAILRIVLYESFDGVFLLREVANTIGKFIYVFERDTQLLFQGVKRLFALVNYPNGIITRKASHILDKVASDPQLRKALSVDVSVVRELSSIAAFPHVLHLARFAALVTLATEQRETRQGLLSLLSTQLVESCEYGSVYEFCHCLMEDLENVDRDEARSVARDVLQRTVPQCMQHLETCNEDAFKCVGLSLRDPMLIEEIVGNSQSLDALFRVFRVAAGDLKRVEWTVRYIFVDLCSSAPVRHYITMLKPLFCAVYDAAGSILQKEWGYEVNAERTVNEEDITHTNHLHGLTAAVSESLTVVFPNQDTLPTTDKRRKKVLNPSPLTQLLFVEKEMYHVYIKTITLLLQFPHSTSRLYTARVAVTLLEFARTGTEMNLLMDLIPILKSCVFILMQCSPQEPTASYSPFAHFVTNLIHTLYPREGGAAQAALVECGVSPDMLSALIYTEEEGSFRTHCFDFIRKQILGKACMTQRPLQYKSCENRPQTQGNTTAASEAHIDNLGSLFGAEE